MLNISHCSSSLLANLHERNPSAAKFDRALRVLVYLICYPLYFPVRLVCISEKCRRAYCHNKSQEKSPDMSAILQGNDLVQCASVHICDDVILVI